MYYFLVISSYKDEQNISTSQGCKWRENIVSFYFLVNYMKCQAINSLNRNPSPNQVFIKRTHLKALIIKIRMFVYMIGM